MGKRKKIEKTEDLPSLAAWALFFSLLSALVCVIMTFCSSQQLAGLDAQVKLRPTFDQVNGSFEKLDARDVMLAEALDHLKGKVNKK